MFLQLLVNTPLCYCMITIIVQHNMDAAEEGVLLTLTCVHISPLCGDKFFILSAECYVCSHFIGHSIIVCDLIYYVYNLT